MSLFPIDDIPEVPILREPRRSRGEHDARFRNDYPPEWACCPDCMGRGALLQTPDGRNKTGAYDDATRLAVAARALPERLIEAGWAVIDCPACLAMGSLKARVRREAGYRCERCKHPYIPKGDAKMLGVEPTPYRWSPCDERCTHEPTRRVCGVCRLPSEDCRCRSFWRFGTQKIAEAEWRILTVHHLDGDKANSAWWNLAVLCQRCHLEIQAKVVMEQVYPHEHTEWFKPHAAGYYARVYLGEDLSRDEVAARLDSLLALEYDPGLTSAVKGDA